MKLTTKQLTLCAVLTALALAFSVQTLAAGRTLVPGGYTVGIKLYMEGLMVTEVEDGAPAQRAGLKKGDVIVSAGETKTDSAQTLLDTVQTPEPVVLRIERGGREAEFLVTPERTADGYRPRVPPALAAACPPGCGIESFLAGLYELSGVKEIADGPPEFLRIGGRRISLKDAAWRLAGLDIGITV